MFGFIASLTTLLACVAAVAGSPASAPHARGQPGPTGFNMCVVSIWIPIFSFISSQHEPWYQRLWMPSWVRDLHSELSVPILLNREVIANFFFSDAQPINLLLPSLSVNTSPKQDREFPLARTARTAK